MIRIPRDKVAIIPIRDADKVGHIWIPDTAKDRVDQGVVKYIGEDVKFVAPGAYVTFSGYSGTLIHIADPEKPDQAGETLIIIREEFIYAEIMDFPLTDVAGLYFKDSEGNEWTPTYEMCMELVARALKESDWRIYDPGLRKGINVIPAQSSYDDYDKMKGG